MNNLNIRRPDLYPHPNCTQCLNYEDNLHLLNCTKITYNISPTIQNLITSFKNPNILSSYQKTQITNILNYYLTSNNSNSLNILMTTQGLISYQLFNALQQYLLSSTNKFLSDLSTSLLIWFKKTIWKQRNDEHHKWEQLRNISSKMKKSKNKTYSATSIQNTPTLLSLSPLTQTNYDQQISKWFLFNLSPQQASLP